MELEKKETKKKKKNASSFYSTCHDIIKFTNNCFQHTPFRREYIPAASGLHSILGKLVRALAEMPVC